MPEMKYLTEPEVAEILRCSTSKVKRMRLSGILPYLPGRPVLIEEEDLAAFVSSRKRRAIEASAKIVDQNTDAGARAWALQQVLLRRRKS